MGGKRLRTKAPAKHATQPAPEPPDKAQSASVATRDHVESAGAARQQTSRKAKRKFGHN